MLPKLPIVPMGDNGPSGINFSINEKTRFNIFFALNQLLLFVWNSPSNIYNEPIKTSLDHAKLGIVARLGVVFYSSPLVHSSLANLVPKKKKKNLLGSWF
jgi:hypothetical protein